MMAKNCYFCKHGQYHAGDYGDYWTPPEPSYTECSNENVKDETLEKHDYNEDVLPTVCGFYEPKIAEKCDCCQKEMNIPEHDVKHFF